MADPTKVDFKKNDLRGTIEFFTREMATCIEWQQIRAKIMRAKYEAFIKEGFTKAQALELCQGEDLF